ncbi:MAG: CDP-alcohol phosphatidyltransferase family protein [Acidobacteria bacterium]|nr:CDP-alcohol phosphatidyltransferase family protein [Acidobacteriota bacterium]
MTKREILTLPNLLSIARGCGIPLFLWLILDLDEPVWGIFVLAIAGITDYLDGKIARAWKQESRLGELLDPAVDRLYIVASLITLYIKDAIPLWMLIVLFGRDLYLGLLLLVLRRFGVAPFKVTYLGKAATFNLLYAFPILLLIKESSGIVSDLAFVFGWSFSAWGIALYLLTAIQYSMAGVREAVAGKKR